MQPFREQFKRSLVFFFQEREPEKPGQTQLCSLHFKALKKKKKRPYFNDLQKVPISPKITSLKKLNKQWTSKNKQKTQLGFFGIQENSILQVFYTIERGSRWNSNDQALPLVCEVLPSEEPGCISFPAYSYTIWGEKKKQPSQTLFMWLHF